MVTNSAIPVLLIALLSPAFAQHPAKEAPQRQSTTQATDALTEAETLLQKQQFAAAAEKLQILVSRNSDNPQAWFDLGFAQSHLGKSTEAIAGYQHAVKLSPKWFEANLNLGIALARNGNQDDAASAFRNAVALKPSSGGDQALSKAWSALAEVLEQSQPDQALAAYSKATALDPHDKESLESIGRLLEARGKFAEAEQQYLKAVDLGSSSALEKLITLYLKQKRLPDAEIWLRRYIDKNPRSAVAQASLGKVLAAEGRTLEAIAVLQTANIDDPQISRQLALLYMENKQYDQAATLLQALIQGNPDDAELYLNLGEALLHQHKYAEAEGVLIKTITQGSCRGECHFLQLTKEQYTRGYSDLAFAAAQNKHYEFAIQLLDARARLVPENAATYWLRATSYDNLHAYKPAIENYKLFLSASAGKSPDQEFQARHRIKALEPN